MTTLPQKVCSRCGLAKDQSAYSRNQANSDGLAYYCKPCQSEYYREWRVRNAEKLKSYNKEWYQVNKEPVKQYRRIHRERDLQVRKVWLKANPDKKIEYDRRYARRHPDAMKQYLRAWNKAHPESMLVQKHRRRARKAQNGGKYTRREWLALCAEYDNRCLCCGRQAPGIRLQVDHVIPISRGGTNDISNIQPLCAECNRVKFTDSTDYRRPKG
jgi:5-methylcytosine-specific restriction endonuclease McrA